ncbi:hypothetical protein [Armatimonas rosea]|uniref:Uncharacterized protein n=1 Tax=Armatimonas rosea TaxID=685828 RepID=A0A7W9ST65_ARMRO|nr:hypothetical protein [Armatimonas rosea]MBB6051833.1 hypothetical protein [Armatimonas rosea]
MMQSQKQHQTHAAVSKHRTGGEWVLLVGSLLATLTGWRSLLRPFRFPLVNWYDGGLAWCLLELALLGTTVALLVHARRIAAFFQALCATAWWFGIVIAVFGFLNFNGRLDAFAVFVCSLLFLIGLVHALIARWLWRLAGMERA